MSQFNAVGQTRFFHYMVLPAPWASESGFFATRLQIKERDLLQGIFPTQGSNLGFLYCRQILYQLSHKGSPRIWEWLAYPSSSRSSLPRNQTGVSRIIISRYFWGLLGGTTDCFLGFPGGTSGKEPFHGYRRLKRQGFDTWVRKIPWRRAWQPTPASLPRESHELRSLEGYSP